MSKYMGMLLGRYSWEKSTDNGKDSVQFYCVTLIAFPAFYTYILTPFYKSSFNTLLQSHIYLVILKLLSKSV